MTPPDAHSSLAALRQLKEMLDAGTITSQEFEVLKRQLVFGVESARPPSPPAGEPAVAASGAPEAPASRPEEPSAAYQTAMPNPPETAGPPLMAGLTAPAPDSAGTSPEWLAAAAPSLLPAAEDALPPAERRNPLNLVFAIGGLLVFLGVIFYLLLGRPPSADEHLTSSTKTAADSVSVAPEVGPQAEQLTLPPVAAPETVRVAPVTRPAATPAASQFRVDSAAAPASQAPVAPPVAVPTDSATTKTP